ncbi:trichohyalin-like [Amphibalanus amphitrite]|uniref:trichohyalin-like n=1 Tax=Amphibalanus amphitrite TaxID=1232801 RepID=UPI001C91C7CA|nr:trichohyalin-like [Amphibalanus amphitrite]
MADMVDDFYHREVDLEELEQFVRHMRGEEPAFIYHQIPPPQIAPPLRPAAARDNHQAEGEVDSDEEQLAVRVQRNIRQMVRDLRKRRRREEREQRRKQRSRRREQERVARESRRVDSLVDRVAADGRLTRLRHNVPLLRQVRLRETVKIAHKIKSRRQQQQ